MLKKPLFLIASLMIASGIIYAENQQHFFNITSWEKGLNNQVSEYLIPDNMGSEAQNVRINDTYGALSKRETMIQYGSAGSFAINGLHRYYRTSDSTKYLVAAGSTKIYYGTDSTGAFTVLKDSLTDGKRFSFVTYKDIVIGMNGYENDVKWDGKTQTTANTDGSRTADNLMADLGAPFAEQNTGSNLDASSWYQYKVAFYNGSTYSYSTTRSNALLTGSTVRDITLTGIPIGPTGTTQRIIYRTVGDASRAAVIADTSFYRVATISDNTTTTYNDAVTDATILADTAPTWSTVSAGSNVTPPKGRYAIIHKEKLFISGNVTNKSDIYWSDNFNPDNFASGDYIQVRPDDGDEITFMKEQLGILAIGKTNTIQKLYTEGSSDTWEVSAPFSFIGCPAAYSAANTPYGIIYLGRDGIYRFTGQSSDLISDAVTPTIRDVLSTNMDKVFGFYHKNEYHMAYTSESSGETSNNRVLVYNLVRDAYVIDTKSVNVMASLNSGDDLGVMYLGSSDTDGYVWANEGAANILTIRYKSQLDSGTYDDTRSTGDEDAPVIELAWDVTIDNMVGTFDANAGIIDRPDTSGTWESPVYEINASRLLTAQWNEILRSSGDVTLQVRTGATTGAVAVAAYSSAVTDPNGSDISGVTAAKYIQVRLNLSTSAIADTPYLYQNDSFVFKINYQKTASSLESSYLSAWKSGWKNLGADGYKKWIKRIKVFYRGTSGTITVRVQNDEGDINRTFDIDLSADGGDAPDDEYTSQGLDKVFTWFPEANSSTYPALIGQFFNFRVTETGTTDWTISRIETEFELQEIYD